MKHDLDVFAIIIKYFFLVKKTIKYQSDETRHVADCVQQFFLAKIWLF